MFTLFPGTHYYDLTTSSDCSTFYPWIGIANNGNVVGIALQIIGTTSVDETRTWNENIPGAGVQVSYQFLVHNYLPVLLNETTCQPVYKLETHMVHLLLSFFFPHNSESSSSFLFRSPSPMRQTVCLKTLISTVSSPYTFGSWPMQLNLLAIRTGPSATSR